jgi:hypothetical protein
LRLLIGRDPRFGQTALNALFSLGFAVLIWAAVGARLTDTQRFRVPFELRVPPDVAVEYRDPYAPPGDRPYVEVLVRGPHEVLTKLNPTEIQGVRELTNLDEASLERGEEREYDNVANYFRIATKGVEVVSTTPDRLKVILSRVGKRAFRVKEEITGNPAPGFRRTAVLLDPDEIDVSGPRALLAKQQSPFKTEPLDISGRRETFTSYRKVHSPDGLTPEDRVRVTVVIEAEPQEREFDFPVRVLTTSETLKPNYTFEPPLKDWHARVLVKGPLEALNALEQRLATFKELPGEPFAFVRLTERLNPGQTDAYVEIVNLPRELSYTKTKFAFAVKEVTK